MVTPPGKRDPAAQEREYAHQRALMVDRHVAARGVKDPRVLDAMREVPRHLFVPSVIAAKAYGRGALPIGSKQTISQPYIVARMIELLDLSGNEKVLEIGTGTGYQAVVLSKLSAKVFSIERLNELALRAAELIRELKIYNVTVKVFDGTYGWSDHAPFDRIIRYKVSTRTACPYRKDGHSHRLREVPASGPRHPSGNRDSDRRLRHGGVRSAGRPLRLERMKVRTLLVGTAIASSILGAVVAYLVLTVPNDLQADALLKAARKEIRAGENDRARRSLSLIVQEYPRTDAAAAATVALVTLADSERQKLLADLGALRSASAAQQKQLAAMTQRLDEIASRPPVIAQAPAKKAPAKRATTKRRSSRRRRH